MFTFAVADARPPILSTLHSLAVHTVLITGAVWGSQAAIATSDGPEIPIDITWRVEPAPRPGTPGGGYVISDAPTIVPTTLPPIDKLPPMDPTTPVVFRDPYFGTSGTPCAAACDTLGTASAAAVLSEREVDDLPELQSAGILRYPTVLASAGMDGAVTLSFVIDREGRVEADGIEVKAATHPGFIAAAKEAALTSRFRPAKKHHESVRVRVVQTVNFRR